MPNASVQYMNRDSEDEALSALLDGELSEEREDALRLRMAEDPRLAERCAELAEVGGLLQKLAEPQPEADRLQRIHQNLRARIEADATEGDEEAETATVIPLSPRRNRTLVGVAAAIAASLALYLSLGEPTTSPELAPSPQATGLADTVSPPLEPAITLPTPVAEVESEASQWAEARAAEPAEAVSPGTVYPEAVTPDLELAQVEESAVAPVVDPASMVLPDTDERLAIALDYEMLADFDVISNLELLEYLGELENVESM